MRIDVLTLFPDMFDAPMNASIVGIARTKGLVDLRVLDLREWALPGVHRQVDDTPYGGGPGMVMRPEPLFEAIAALRAEEPPPHVVLLTPQGRRLDHALVEDLAGRERIALVCGRYEGFDERVRTVVDDQVSLGDFVLAGGEIPAMAIIEAAARLQPGALGHENSTNEESFTWGLLEYPQYTRPPEYEGLAVPEVLVSGDHERIRAWRRREAIRRTAALRPDLLETARLTPEERTYARSVLDDIARHDREE